MRAGLLRPTGADRGAGPSAVGWALGGILLLGLVLRVFRLGYRSLWFDEAYTLVVARRSLPEILQEVRWTEPHPPLHFLVAHVWQRLGGESEVWVRLLAVACGMGVIALTYWLGARMLGRRAGLLGAGLVALSPFAVMSSQEARMYSPLVVLGLGSSYAFWLAVEEGRRRHWAAYVATGALALYTHYFAGLILLGHLGYLLWARRDARLLARWAAAQGAILLLFLPWLPALVHQVGAGFGSPPWRPRADEGTLVSVLILLSFGGSFLDLPAYYVSGTAAPLVRLVLVAPFLALVGVAAARAREDDRAKFLVCITAIPLGVAFLVGVRWISLFNTRYFSFLVPPFVLLVVLGMIRLPAVLRVRPASVRAAALALILAYCAPALAAYYFDPNLAITDWRGAMRYIQARATRDDLVLVTPLHAVFPFSYYFKGPQRTILIYDRGQGGGPASPGQGGGSTQPPLDARRARREALRHPRAWMVVARPITIQVAAVQRLEAALEAAFTLEEQRNFNGITVTRLRSRFYQPAPGQGRDRP